MDRTKQIADMTPEHCERAWAQIVEVYGELLNPVQIKAVADGELSPRWAIKLFAEYANGAGKFKVATLLRRHNARSIGTAKYRNICQAAAKVFNVLESELTNRHRFKRVVQARMVITAICHERMGMSYPQIAEWLRGDRWKHSTVHDCHARLKEIKDAGGTLSVWDRESKAFAEKGVGEVLEMIIARIEGAG